MRIFIFLCLFFFSSINRADYTVDYGDGNTATIVAQPWTSGSHPQIASHQYAANGFYTVTITADVDCDNDGNADASKLIDTLQIIVGNIKQQWDYGDGQRTTSSTDPCSQALTAQPHQYAVAGTYTVSYTAKESNGQITTDTIVVTVTSGGGGGTPTGFNAFDSSTASNKITGNLKTRIKDNNGISFDIIALNASNTAVDTNFSGNVKVELLANMTPVSTDTNNCPNSSTLISTRDPATISNGRSIVTLPAVSNVWKNVTVRISHPSVNPTITSCSNDLFAIRPDAFTLQASHLDWENAGDPISNTEQLNATIADNSTIKHKAGKYFSLKIDAVDSGGSITTNYTDTDTLTSSSQLLEPSGGIPGTFSKGTLSALNGGVITSNTATYSEVGFFSLQFTDTTFAGIDASDGSTLSERTIASPVITVGRFTPDHFEITDSQNGIFSDACTGFTYSGQTFSYLTAPTLTVTAYSGLGSVTENYTGSYRKLNATDFNVTPPTTDKIQLGADGSTLVNLESWIPGTASLTDNMDGSLTFAFVNDAFTYQHENNSKIAPFTPTVDLIFTDITDSDSVQTQGLSHTIQASGSSIRFGRLNIENAHGSELLPLAVPVYTEYYNGTSFLLNTDDTCTSINIAQLSFNGGTNPITVGSATSTASIANSPLVLGLAGLSLSAPGDTGFIDITSSIFISSFPWLNYDWDGDGSHDDSPSARATFGIYKGNSQQIYFREVY